MNTSLNPSLNERQQEFIELFESLESWQERFQYLIDIGCELAEMAEDLKNPSSRIQWCLSQTYFVVSVTQGIVRIQGWSNSSIVSGLIVMLQMIFDGSSMDELQELEIDFHLKTSLRSHLSEQRKLTLDEMLARIQDVR